jgi:hypothetical protein
MTGSEPFSSSLCCVNLQGVVGSGELAVTQANDKDGSFPDPSMALPGPRGDSPPDHVPALTVLR